MSKDTVIVIKSTNYSEADKILTVFGKYRGKFTVIAKGIRKITSRNRGNMQTLSISKISFYEGKGLPILTESEQIYAPEFANRFDFKNIERILYMLNKFLVEGEENRIIFNLSHELLKGELNLLRVNKFRIRILKELGFLGDFKSCSLCDSQDRLDYLDLKNFVIVCHNCYSSLDKGVKLNKDIYETSVFTESLDRYITRIVEEI